MSDEDIKKLAAKIEAVGGRPNCVPVHPDHCDDPVVMAHAKAQGPGDVPMWTPPRRKPSRVVAVNGRGEEVPGWTLIDYDAEMREVYHPDGPTAKGREILAEHEARRLERNKAIAALIDRGGHLTEVGYERISDLVGVLVAAVRPHLDNTGGVCRGDLDGHDCCYVCNQAEDMLRATAAYYEGE